MTSYDFRFTGLVPPFAFRAALILLGNDSKLRSCDTGNIISMVEPSVLVSSLTQRSDQS